VDLSPHGDEQARLAARVGAPLAAARAEAGLTIAALARRSGVGASTVSALERGRTRPRRVTLQRLADVLLAHDQAAAFAFAEQLAEAAGPSLVGDVTLPVSVARETVVEILYRSMVELGMDPADERVRAVVVEQIRAVAGDQHPAPGAAPEPGPPRYQEVVVTGRTAVSEPVPLPSTVDGAT